MHRPHPVTFWRFVRILGALLIVLAPASRARADDWLGAGFDAVHARATTERLGRTFSSSWSASLGSAYALSTPAAADGVVVMGTRDGSVLAFGAGTGRLSWKFATGDSVQASPSIHRGRVYVSSLDGHLYALRLADGSLLWERHLGGLEQASPTIVGESVLVPHGFPGRTLARLDASTGETLWETAPDVLGQFGNSSPASDGQQVFVAVNEGQLASFDLATGNHLWTYQSQGLVNTSAPLVADGRVYLLPGGDSGKLHAVDALTGKAAPGWPLDVPSPNPPEKGRILNRQFSGSSLAVAGANLVFNLRVDDALDTNDDGRVDGYLLRESTMALRLADGQLVWQRERGSKTIASANELPSGWLCATPAVFQSVIPGASAGALLLAVASSLAPTLAVLDAATGQEAWAGDLPGTSRLSPVAVNGRLLVATDVGTLTTFTSRENRPPIAPTLTGGPSRTVGNRDAVVAWSAALDPDDDPVSYQVRLDRDGELLETWEATTTTAPWVTSWRVPTDLTTRGTTMVAVRARDGNGAWSDWSAPQFLSAVEAPPVTLGGQLVSSLAEALRVAGPGDVVAVGAGRFVLGETLRVRAGVSLAGAGPGRTILEGTGLERAVSVEGTAAGQPAKLTQLSVTGARVGVFVAAGEEAQLAHVILADHSEAGLDVASGAKVEARHVSVVANGTGARVAGSLRLRNSLVLSNHVGLSAAAPDAIDSRFDDVFDNAIDHDGLARGAEDLAVAVKFMDFLGRDLHVLDAQPTTDQGDPTDDVSHEPAPRGTRVNLGAYGGTVDAERSAPLLVADAGSAVDAAGAADVAGSDGGRTEAGVSTNAGTGGASSRGGATGTSPTPDKPDPQASGGGCNVAATAEPSTSLGLAFGAFLLLARRFVVARRRRGRGALFTLLVLALVAGFVPAIAEAATCNWNQGSPQSFSGSTGYWSCGHVPTTGDDVVFTNTATGTCTISTSVSVNSLTFNNGAGTVNGGSATIALTGNFSMAGGTFVSTSGRLQVGGGFSITSGTFTHNSGTVMLTSTSPQTFATNGAVFKNVIVNDGLVGYWKLDETSVGTAVDSSGYGNNGTHTNSPSTSDSSVPSAIKFTDGRSLAFTRTQLYTSTPYVTTSASALATELQPTVVTMSAWYKAGAVDGQGSEIVSGANRYALRVFSSTQLKVVKQTAASTWVELTATVNNPADSNWHHMAGVITASGMTAYFDGVAVGSNADTTAIYYTGVATGLNIGRNPLTEDYNFQGNIDEVRVYKRALTAAEISALALGRQPATSAATETLSGAPNITGDLVLASGLFAAGANNFSVGGSWWNYGGQFTSSSNTVTLNGSGTNYLQAGGQRFANVTYSGAGSMTLRDRVELDPASTLTVSAGTFDLSSHTLRAGQVRRSGGNTLTASTSTVVLGGSASGTADAGGYYNLKVEPVTSTQLTGYWKLDEGAGLTARDYSGAAHHGTLTSGPLWADTSGVATGTDFENPSALRLDGVDDYVDVGSGVLDPTTAFTVCSWVNMTSFSLNGGYQYFVSKSGTTGASFYLARRGDTSKFSFMMTAGDGVVSTRADQASTAPSAGTWYHVCGSYDTSNIRLYVNGTLESTTAFTSGWNLAGGATIIGAGKVSGAFTDWVQGSMDDVRIYNTALSSSQVAALAAGTYPAGLSSVPTYTLGYDTTVSGTYVQDGGTVATSTYAVNLSGTGTAAALNSGTFTLGSGINTFAAGLNVAKYATLNMATSGGTAKIGSTKTLNIDGTFNASSTGAIIQTAGSASTTYTFTVGGTSTAAPTLNITGLQVKNLDANGMYINSWAGAGNSTTSYTFTSFTRFDNIAFSTGTSGTTNRLLRIYATSLYLVSNGCSFDNSTGKNVTLTGDGSTTETRALFGGATCTNTPCETYDDDDDGGPDGLGDNTGSNAAVIQWPVAAMADTDGTIEGFPTAAFDWDTFTFFASYVSYHDVAGGTADRVYVRSSTGAAKYYWTGPTGEELIGAPRFNKISGSRYVFVATTSGHVYRLLDNGTSTLTTDWTYDCSCTINTPLGMDTTNLYFGGTTSGPTAKYWNITQSAGALANGSYPFSLGSVTLSSAAPAIASLSNVTYLFGGLSGHFYKFNMTSAGLTTDNSSPTGTVNGRLTVYANKTYGIDNAGKLWVLDAVNFSNAALWSYQYASHSGGCSAGSVCGVTSPPYIDLSTGRAYWGDSDGHLYGAYNSTGTTGALVWASPYSTGNTSDVFSSAPLYQGGYIVAGSTIGNLYILNATGPSLVQTYKFGTSTRISGVSYDSDTNAYIVSTANATNKDGKLIYVPAY